MLTAQPHMRSLRFAFVNMHGPYHYSVFFASHSCYNQSEHLCRLVSKGAGRKKAYMQMSCVEFSMFLLSLWKNNAIVTSAQFGLSLFWWETPEFEPRSRRIFSTVHGVPLHTAFLFHLFVVLIWLKYCWKGGKIESYPFILVRYRMYICFRFCLQTFWLSFQLVSAQISQVATAFHFWLPREKLFLRLMWAVFM